MPLLKGAQASGLVPMWEKERSNITVEDYKSFVSVAYEGPGFPL
jgi:hypothetical protein